MNISTLEIQMVADVAKLRQDVGQAVGILEEFRGAAEMATKALGALGIATSVAGLGAFIEKTIEAAGEMYKLSERTGVAVESLSALRGAAKLSGTGMDEVAGGLQKLSKNLVEAQGGTGKAAQAFEDLGVKITDSNGHLRNADVVMLDVAKAMQGFEDGSGKTAAMMAIFGKTGANLIPMLNELAEKGNLNGKMTTEQARQAHEFEKSLAKLKMTTEGYMKTLAMDLLPVITALPGLFKILGEAAVGGFAIFVGLPAVMAASITAFNAFAVAVYEGNTLMGMTWAGLNTSMLTLGPTFTGLTAQVGIFRAAVMTSLGAVFAGFVGWEIGTWLRNNFVEAQLAGVAFVDGTLKGWEAIKYGASVAWVAVKAAAVTALEGIGTFFGGLMDHVASGLRALGATGAADTLNSYAERLRAATAPAASLQSQLAQLKKEYESGKKAVEDITDAMASDAIANFQAAEATEQHKKKMKDHNAELAAAKDAYDKLMQSLGQKIALQNLEIQSDGKLTEGQKEALKIMEDLRTGNLKLTDAQKLVVEKVLEGILANEKSLDVMKREREGTAAAQQVHKQYVDALYAEVEKTQDAVAKQREHNETIGKSKEAVAELEAARLQDAATLEEIQAIKKLDRDGDEAAYNIAMNLAKAKRELASAKLSGAVTQTLVDEAKKAAEEWKRTADSINTTLTDALMRAFESGSGFGKAFVKTVEDMFKMMVLRPVISAIMTPISGIVGGVVNSALGIGVGSAAMSTAATVGGISAASSIFGGFGNSAAATIANITGTGLDGMIAATGGYGTMGAGGAATSALGAIPGWGWAAMGVMALASLSGKFKGETRQGGQYALDANGARFLQGPSGGQIAGDDVLKMMNQTSAGTDELLKLLGSSASVTQMYGGLESSNKGRGGVYAGIQLSSGQFVGMNGSGSNYAGTMYDKAFSFNMDSQQAMAAFVTELKQTTLQALQAAADVPKSIKDMIGSQDVKKLTDQQASALLDAISKLANGINLLRDTFPQLSTATFDAMAAIAKLSGGIAALTTNVNNYYKDFYTQAERDAKVTADLNAQFQTLGLQMPTTREGYRALVEAQNLSTEAGQKNYAALVAMASAFAQVTPVAQATTKAVQDNAAAQKALEASLKSASDAAFQALQRAVQAQQQVADEQVKMLTGILDLLGSNIRELRNSASGTVGTAARGNSFIDQALATARATGYMPDQAQLANAIQDARGGLNTNNYKSEFEFKNAQAVLANKLEQLSGIAKPQLDAAQQQLSYLERTLKVEQDSLDALRGVDNSIKSVAQAIADFHEALTHEQATAKAAKAAAAAGAAVGVGGGGVAFGGGGGSSASSINGISSKDAWDFIDKNYGDPTVMAAAAKAHGLTIGDIASLTNFPKSSWEVYFRDAGIPSFAVGTPYLPEDMILKGHKGEAIMPAATAQRWRDGDGGTAVASAIENLRTDQRAQMAALLDRLMQLFTLHRRWDGDGLPATRST